MNLLFCPGVAFMLEKREGHGPKKTMARKQGALSHMTQACKTVKPYCFPSCPSRTYHF